MARSPTFTESEWSVLAGIRFLLAMVVVSYHLYGIGDSTASMLRFLGSFGAQAAVIGFFVISGASIGHSYRQNPSGYFRRRFLRIYPLYFVAVALSVLLAAMIGADGPYLIAGWKTTVANFFFLQNWIAISITYDTPVWTLGIEVFFYALAPLLFRLKPLSIIVVALASLAYFSTSPAYRLFGHQMLPYAWPWLAGFLFTAFGLRVVGGLIAFAGIIPQIFLQSPGHEPLNGLSYCLAVAAVFIPLRIQLSPQVRAFLNFLGEQSYPLYLFHMPVAIGLYYYAGMRNLWAFVACIFVSVFFINLVFDHWLKELFWKPAVKRVTFLLSRPRTATLGPTGL